jgi:hypothetical protein
MRTFFLMLSWVTALSLITGTAFTLFGLAFLLFGRASPLAPVSLVSFAIVLVGMLGAAIIPLMRHYSQRLDDLDRRIREVEQKTKANETETPQGV